MKRQKTSECPSPPTESTLEWNNPEQNEWPLSTIVQYLLEDVLSTEWEHRHGAAIGLRLVSSVVSRDVMTCHTRDFVSSVVRNSRKM